MSGYGNDDQQGGQGMFQSLIHIPHLEHHTDMHQEADMEVTVAGINPEVAMEEVAAATNLEGDTAEIVVETNNRVVVWEATAAGTNPEEGMEMIAVETNLEEAATVVGINPEVSGSSS